MTCKSSTIDISEAASNTLPNIPGFGIPQAPSLPENPLSAPLDQPEDLQSLIQSMSLIFPTGTQYPNLGANFSKDLTDGLYSLMEQAAPFLNTFKFFLPFMRLVTGIIEVICALLNPFSLFGAINKLFNDYLPAFLAMYPPFSLVVLVISIAKLILQFVDYMLNQVNNLVNEVKSNLKNFSDATERNNKDAIKATTNKIQNLFCDFQNLFVAFNMVTSVIEVINDILNFGLNIPCSDGNGCCDSNVCPAFLKNGTYTATGTLQYFTSVPSSTPFSFFFGTTSVSNNLRNQMYQIYDVTQSATTAFSNIFDASDATANPKPIFFPTDSVISSTTPVLQAPYSVDVRLYFVPAQFGQTGTSRYIRFKGCIVLTQGSTNLINFDGTSNLIPTGVLLLGGGLAYEDDGTTAIYVSGKQATLETLLFLPPVSAPSPGDVITLTMEYTFTPNYEALFAKSLITAGCAPSIRASKEALASTYPLPEIPPMPDLVAPLTAMQNEVTNVVSNLNSATLDAFSNNMTTILNSVKDSTSAILAQYFDLAFDRFQSGFTLSPAVQWINQTIGISIIFKDRNGNVLSNGLTGSVITHIIKNLKIKNSFGSIQNVRYDGSEFFLADLDSASVGNGTLGMVYNNQVFASLVVNTDLTIPSTIVDNVKDYSFLNNVSLENVPSRTDQDLA